MPPPYGPGAYPPPPEDTTWPLLAYLGQFAVGFVAPLVVYLARKDQSPFSRFHGAQALNLALSSLILWFFSVLVVMVGVLAEAPIVALAILPAAVFYVAHFVYLIIAAVRVGRYEMYRIPAWICWPMVR